MKNLNNESVTEDLMSSWAFGDLSEAEEVELQALADEDPQLMAEMTKLFQIRDGLRDLADSVPDHQLSNERLREAILRQGLKPKPNGGADWSWLWPSLATCLAAVALVTFVRHSQTVQSQVVGVATVPAMTVPSFTHPAPGLVSRELAHSPSVVAANLTPRTTPVVTSAVVHSPVRVARRRHHKSILQHGFPNSWVALASHDSNTAASQPDASQALKPVDGDPQSGLVLIDSVRDVDTGSQSAREVASGSNVVVRE